MGILAQWSATGCCLHNVLALVSIVYIRDQREVAIWPLSLNTESKLNMIVPKIGLSRLLPLFIYWSKTKGFFFLLCHLCPTAEIYLNFLFQSQNRKREEIPSLQSDKGHQNKGYKGHQHLWPYWKRSSLLLFLKQPKMWDFIFLSRSVIKVNMTNRGGTSP